MNKKRGNQSICEYMSCDEEMLIVIALKLTGSVAFIGFPLPFSARIKFFQRM